MIDAEMLNTVVAADTEMDLPPSFQTTTDGRVDRNTARSRFVNVPAGTNELNFDLRNLDYERDGAQLRIIATDPLGIPADGAACYTNYSDAAECDPWRRTYKNPMPGIWEFKIEARRTSLPATSPYELSVTGTGLEINNLVKSSCNNYWPLDGTTREAKGVGFDLYNYPGPTGERPLAGAPGRHPNGRTAMHFSGNPGVGLISDETSTTLSTERALNVGAWVRLTDTDRTHTAVAAYGPTGINRYLPPGLVFELGYSKEHNGWSFVATDATPGPAANLIRLTSSAVETNVWTHLMATYYPGRGITLYVNGEMADSLDSDDSWKGTLGWASSPFLSVGRFDSDDDDIPDTPWKGEISDVCFDNSVGPNPINIFDAKRFGDLDFDLVTRPSS